VLLDDVGFGAGSAFGGACEMPTAERVAANGLKFTRFHTTVLCSPTRAAMITGRNHHSVGMGHITENASASPGRTSVRPNSTAPVPEILRLNGYSTHGNGRTLQEAADDLISRLLRLAMAARASGLRSPGELGAPDHRLFEFVWELGERAARGEDIRERVFCERPSGAPE
jgi:hypothetical protein